MRRIISAMINALISRNRPASSGRFTRRGGSLCSRRHGRQLLVDRFFLIEVLLKQSRAIVAAKTPNCDFGHSRPISRRPDSRTEVYCKAHTLSLELE